jgi:hypothetical protein
MKRKIEVKVAKLMARSINLVAGALATGLLLTLSVVAAAQTTVVVPGQPERSLGGPTIAQTPMSTSENEATKHTLRGTFDNSGTWSGDTFPGGNMAQPVDNQITVDCPSSSTCTIEADVWIEEGDATVASQGGLCVYIDSIAYNCADNNYSEPNIVRNFSEIINFTDLAPGNHTVQSFLYSGSGTRVWDYFTTYRVFTP